MDFHIYTLPINSVIAITVVGLTSWTIVYAVTNNTQDGRINLIWRVINGGVAVVTLIIILNYTLMNRTADGIHTMPYALGSNSITEKSRKKYFPVFITIIAALLLSIGIELIQHLYNFGNAELSDIIMNTLGAAIGTVSYGISQKLLN